MKPRKEGESDASYIARLETSHAGLRKSNDRLKKDHTRLYDFIVPAAQYAGQVLDAAAEGCGMSDDPEVVATKKGLYALGSCIWNDDSVVIPPLPSLREDSPEFNGDAEMILKSALERVKQNRPPWESWSDLIPEYKGKKPEDMDWQGAADEVFDALTNLEFGRGLLRLDLRSTMYDYCFERISRALRALSERQRHSEVSETSARPSDDVEMIPF